MMSYEKLTAALAEKNISQTAYDNIQTWLNGPRYAQYKQELESLIEQSDWKTLEDNFFQVLPFGTGGRRGTVGIGPNRINDVTIGESAQGFANYLISALGDAQAKQQGIVIAHDTRTSSRELAELTAAIFAGNGFTTYIFDSFRATPELSFAVRHLGCAGGIVISASHNPPADNGFKAYWSDGAQVVPPHDTGILKAVEAVTDITTTDFATATANNAITIISSAVDTAYIAALKAESLSASRTATIIYSPLHGTGTKSVQPILEAAGFTNLTIVSEQATPDGTFPNCPDNIPNPEVETTGHLAIEYAKRLSADIAITTDPDADRLGVIVRDQAGEYKFLTGNQIAALVADYVASSLKEQGKLKDNMFMARTIVTTDFLDAIAADAGVKIYNNLLVGFKYIGELIRLKQDEGTEQFLFGGEESYGFLKGSYTRDKDAAVAALLICELASKLKDEGKTLLTRLTDLYRQYGIYRETLENVKYPGAEGFTQMSTIMQSLRQNPPKTLADMPVHTMVDRQTGTTFDIATEKKVGTVDGITGNVLVFTLSDDGHTRLTVRPSGTEPKMKIYAQIHQPIAPDSSDEELQQALTQADTKASQLIQALLEYTAAQS